LILGGQKLKVNSFLLSRSLRTALARVEGARLAWNDWRVWARFYIRSCLLPMDPWQKHWRLSRIFRRHDGENRLSRGALHGKQTTCRQNDNAGR